MKRDVDLIRQLLFDIERHGAECSFDGLRNGTVQENDERLRYHVRLLIDAGLAKEIDRTSAGQPCVRLSSAGHEFLELCRNDARWREAKWIVQEQTGGCSLTVLRAVLTKWAIESIAHTERRRTWKRTARPQYDRVYYREAPRYREWAYGEPVYRVESYRYEREPLIDEDPVQFARPRREYRDAVPAERWEFDSSRPVDAAEEQLGISLPVQMI